MAKKLISRQQQKPTLKKIKKYSLAGYNLSGVSQAPQASYYLGQSAAEEAGQNQNTALQALQETQSTLKEANAAEKEQKQAAVQQSSMELGKLALSTGKDIIQERAAKKAAELAAKEVAKNAASTTAKEFGTNAIMAADTGADLASAGATIGAGAASAAPSAFMSGVASYGQPVSAALAIGGEIIKNTGSDNNAATFTQKERNRYGVGNTMAKTGQFAGYGSMFGPVGTLVGAAAGLGYGIYDTIKDNKKSEEEAGKLSMAARDPMAAANNAFIDSKMMDAYRGGNQMVRYGGMKYEMGGSGCPPGQTMNPYTGQCEQIKIDWSNPGQTLSIDGAAVNDYTGLNRREARDVYQQNKQQYNIDFAKARRIDIDSADPRTLQSRIPYPQMPYSPAEQRRVDAGKEPGTFFDYYQKDPKRAGTRMANRWDNNLMEGDEDLGFRQATPDYSEEAQEAARQSRSGVGNFLHDMFKEKPKYGGDHSKRQTKPAPGQRRQDNDCKKKLGQKFGCGSKEYGGYRYEFGGTYNDLGGTRYAEGGVIKPIPNSNDVAFVGDSHEQGGIKLDKYTEVEGGETGTNINGNQYFFSRVLKTPQGNSYADFHKKIASDPSLDAASKKKIIKDLARQQEEEAGRDPKQIARSGGMRKFAAGGMGCPDGYINDPVYGCIPAVQDETKMNFVESGAYMNGKSPYDMPADVKEQTFNPNDLRSKKSVTDAEVKEFAKDNDYVYDSKKKVYVKTDGKTKVKKTAEELKKELAEGKNSGVFNNITNVYKPKAEEIPKELLKENQAGPVVKGNGKLDSFGYTLDKEIPEKGLNLSKTWLERHPGVIGGAAQLIGPAYAMLKPYKKSPLAAAASTISAPQLARVDKSGEMEDARRQQNAMNTYLKNTNLGPARIIAMQNVATRTADEIRKISESQDAENRAIKNAEAQIGAEVAGRNQAAQVEISKSNMLADINQNQYNDERNLGVAEGLGKGLAGISKDQRMLDMQYDIARGTDPTGAFNRYEIMEKLRELSNDPKSPMYKKSEQELQQIASDLGYNVVKVVADDEKKKKFGGFKGVKGKKYTSRLGQLATNKNTGIKKLI
jgi:hypothetical protein